MSTARSRRPLAELARLGNELLERQVQPKLGPEEDSKFVAVDVETGEYEVDEDDYTAISRLRGRCPGADVWLGCVGQPTAYKMRRGR